jgi:hypothetical protein
MPIYFGVFLISFNKNIYDIYKKNYKNNDITLSGGSLGSWVDEERSKLCVIV